MHWKKIHKLATKLSQNVLGSLDYLKHYNKAHKQVEQKLTDNKCREYKAMAKEWLEKKLPLQMQQQYAHGNDSSRLEQCDFFALA
jgi:hypothetical protein